MIGRFDQQCQTHYEVVMTLGGVNVKVHCLVGTVVASGSFQFQIPRSGGGLRYMDVVLDDIAEKPDQKVKED